MKCAMCKDGSLEPGHVTVTLERGTAVLIFRNVPARVCEACGEEYVSAETHRALLRQAESELERGVVLEMLEFAA